MSITVWDPDAGDSLVARIGDARATLDAAASTLAARTQPVLSSATPLPYSAGAVQAALQQVETAHDTLLAAGASLDGYASTTQTVGSWYGWAESTSQWLTEQAAGTVAYMLGRSLGPFLVPVAALGAAVLATVESARPGTIDALLGMLPDDRGQLEELMNQPAVVGVVELVVDSTDELLAGAGVLPASMSSMLGGRTDAEAAGSVVGLLALGANVVRAGGALVTGRPLPRHVLGGTPVATRVDEGVATPQAPVTSTEQALDVISTADSDIVIQEHVLPDGSSHWQVFVQGTEDWALDSGSTGEDLGGALQNATNQPDQPLAGSAAAVEEAMLAAGIGEGDSVDMFGFSQGGQAVANVAATGQFSVQQVVTYGAPVGSVVMPGGVEHLAIETTGDITGSAGGTPTEGTSTVVQVAVPDEVVEDLTEGDMAYVHEHDDAVYAWAAQQVDESGDPLLTQFDDDLAADLQGAAAGETTEWEIER